MSEAPTCLREHDRNTTVSVARGIILVCVCAHTKLSEALWSLAQQHKSWWVLAVSSVYRSQLHKSLTDSLSRVLCCVKVGSTGGGSSELMFPSSSHQASSRCCSILLSPAYLFLTRSQF